MYFRVIVNRNSQYDPSASSQEPLTCEAAEAFGQEQLAKGLQVFIVNTDPPSGVVDPDPEPHTHEPWRVIPPFEG